MCVWTRASRFPCCFAPAWPKAATRRWRWPITTATPRPSARVFDLAWAHSQVELRHLQITTADVHLFQRLATHLLYTGPALAPPPTCWLPIGTGSPDCGGTAFPATIPSCLSASLPPSDLPLVRHLLLAHSYLAHEGLQRRSRHPERASRPAMSRKCSSRSRKPWVRAIRTD